jgi:hypothetical protein
MIDPSHELNAEFLLFAETANYTRDGRLNLIGEFNRIHVHGVPFVLPMLTVVFRVTGTRAAFQYPRSLAIRINDPSGSPRLHFGLSLSWPSGPQAEARVDGDVLQYTWPVQFVGQMFPSFGRYRVTLEIGGEDAMTRDLHVVEWYPGSRG